MFLLSSNCPKTVDDTRVAPETNGEKQDWRVQTSLSRGPLWQSAHGPDLASASEFPGHEPLPDGPLQIVVRGVKKGQLTLLFVARFNFSCIPAILSA